MIFEAPGALQALFGTPASTRRAVAEVERATGVSVSIRGGEVTLRGAEAACAAVEAGLRQAYELGTRGQPLRPEDLGRALAVLSAAPDGRLEACSGDVPSPRRGGRGPRPRAPRFRS